MERPNDLNFNPDESDAHKCDAQESDAPQTPTPPLTPNPPKPEPRKSAQDPPRKSAQKADDNAPSELMTLMNLSQGIISHDLSAFIHGLASARERMTDDEFKRFITLVNREFNLWNPHAQIKGTTTTSGRNPQLVMLISAKSKDLWGMRCVKANQVHDALTIGQMSG